MIVCTMTTITCMRRTSSWKHQLLDIGLSYKKIWKWFLRLNYINVFESWNLNPFHASNWYERFETVIFFMTFATSRNISSGFFSNLEEMIPWYCTDLISRFKILIPRRMTRPEKVELVLKHITLHNCQILWCSILSHLF